VSLVVAVTSHQGHEKSRDWAGGSPSFCVVSGWDKKSLRRTAVNLSKVFRDFDTKKEGRGRSGRESSGLAFLRGEWRLGAGERASTGYENSDYRQDGSTGGGFRSTKQFLDQSKSRDTILK